MICASVYLLVFMSVILQYLTDLRSTFKWYGWKGAGQTNSMVNLNIDVQLSKMLFQILHLLAHLLDEYLQLNRGVGHLGVNRF